MKTEELQIPNPNQIALEKWNYDGGDEESGWDAKCPRCGSTSSTEFEEIPLETDEVGDPNEDSYPACYVVDIETDLMEQCSRLKCWNCGAVTEWW